MLRPRAASARYSASALRSARKVFSKIPPRSMRTSLGRASGGGQRWGAPRRAPAAASSDPLRAAEEALRPDPQDEDEHDQRADVLQLGGDHQRRELGEDADHQAADQRAERRGGAPDG